MMNPGKLFQTYSTFHLTVHSICISDVVRVVIMHVGRKEMFYLTTHSTFYLQLYGVRHMVAREETRCRHMGYSFRLAARVLLYAPSHRQDSTYHSLNACSDPNIVLFLHMHYFILSNY